MLSELEIDVEDVWDALEAMPHYDPAPTPTKSSTSVRQAVEEGQASTSASASSHSPSPGSSPRSLEVAKQTSEQCSRPQTLHDASLEEKNGDVIPQVGNELKLGVEESRLKVDEEKRKAVETRLKREEEIKKSMEEPRRTAEEEEKHKADEKAALKVDEEKQKAEEEERQKAYEARLKEEKRFFFEARVKTEEEAQQKAWHEARLVVEREAIENTKERREADEARVQVEKQEADEAEEANLKAEEETKRKAEEEDRLTAEREAKKQLEERRKAYKSRLKEDKQIAEESRLKAEEDTIFKVEKEASLKAEREAEKQLEERQKAYEARLKEEKQKAEEARLKVEEETKRKAEEETKLTAEGEAKKQLEERAKAYEARLKEEKQKAEEAILKAEEETKRKAEEVARLKAEREAKKQLEERRKAYESRLKEEKEKAEETRLKAEEETKWKAEEEARMLVEREATEIGQEERQMAEASRADASASIARQSVALSSSTDVDVQSVREFGATAMMGNRTSIGIDPNIADVTTMPNRPTNDDSYVGLFLRTRPNSGKHEVGQPRHAWPLHHSADEVNVNFTEGMLASTSDAVQALQTAEAFSGDPGTISVARLGSTQRGMTSRHESLPYSASPDHLRPPRNSPSQIRNTRSAPLGHYTSPQARARERHHQSTLSEPEVLQSGSRRGQRRAAQASMSMGYGRRRGNREVDEIGDEGLRNYLSSVLRAVEEAPALHAAASNMEVRRARHRHDVEAVIQTLDSFIASENLPDACAICLEEMGPSHQIARLACRHCFHLTCIRRWLPASLTCPLCKQPAQL